MDAPQKRHLQPDRNGADGTQRSGYLQCPPGLAIRTGLAGTEVALDNTADSPLICILYFTKIFTVYYC